MYIAKCVQLTIAMYYKCIRLSQIIGCLLSVIVMVGYVGYFVMVVVHFHLYVAITRVLRFVISQL